jgi:hypothetical protein
VAFSLHAVNSMLAISIRLRQANIFLDMVTPSLANSYDEGRSAISADGLILNDLPE